METRRFIRWRASTKTLSEMAAYVTTFATISTPDGASRAVVARVSPRLFPMLGARMQLGRGLVDDEEHTNSSDVVLSADAFAIVVLESRWRAARAGSAGSKAVAV